ncbi:MAG: hypothetical protein Q9213_008344 [Squamulea squamosa]
MAAQGYRQCYAPSVPSTGPLPTPKLLSRASNTASPYSQRRSGRSQMLVPTRRCLGVSNIEVFRALFQGELVGLVTANRQAEFWVHRKKLYDASPGMRQRFEANRESNRVIVYDAANAEILYRFVLWVSSGSLLEREETVTVFDWEALLAIRDFGDHYTTPGLQNDCIDTMIALRNEGQLFPFAALQMVFPDADANLKRFLGCICVIQPDLLDYVRDDDIGDVFGQFTLRYMLALDIVLRRGGGDISMFWQDQMPGFYLPE